MSRLEMSWRVRGQRRTPQDRVAVLRRGELVVGVVADGAGGTSGGTAAATRVIDDVGCVVASSGELMNATMWGLLLIETGARLASMGAGQTTAVIAATDGSLVIGASVGDSGAWLVGPDSLADLSDGQQRRPLLGGGTIVPHAFKSAFGPGQTLLLATDGLFSYTQKEPLCAAVRHKTVSLEALADSLVDLVRLPRGGLQDDIGLIIVRRS